MCCSYSTVSLYQSIIEYAKRYQTNMLIADLYDACLFRHV